MRLFAKLLCVLLLTGCGGGGSSTDTVQPQRIVFSGGGTLGIFDPSITRDPSTTRLWMSYSSVDQSIYHDPSLYWKVSVRLAYSDDNGVTWQDGGVVVAPVTEQLLGPLATTNPAPAISAGSKGIWQSETSTLVYDPAAPANERWKLLWFQYLNANLTSYFVDYSWLAMKMASTPQGLATATPVKLFSGFGVQADGENTGAPAYSPIAGPPVIRLNSDLTRAVTGADVAELQYCVFAEPGMHATNSALYLAVFCIDPVASKKYIVGFRCISPCNITNAANWEYLGRLVSGTDAAAIGFDHLQAPELMEQAGRFYLLVTPVDTTSGNRYDGCRVYEFSDIDAGSLVRNAGGLPVEILRIDGQAGLHNGACSALEGLQGGVLYIQFEPMNPPDKFRVYKSGISIP